MKNMDVYNKVRTVPSEALKPIAAGRLKGFSDINPMWRIKVLTETFGACGIGWWYEITDKRLVPDETTHQVAAFMDILLYYKNPETGEVSHGIPGTGGSVFVAQESKGAYMSDECFKMALTDAISVAAKALGVAADVYYAKDRSKYTVESDDADTEEDAKPAIPKKSAAICSECGVEVSPAVNNFSIKVYKRCLCLDCQKKAKA